MDNRNNGIKAQVSRNIKENKEKIVLKGMILSELEDWCLDNHQTRFRGRQLFEWMYRHGQNNAQAMTNISAGFRNYIYENCILSVLTLEKQSKSNNEATIKYLFRLHDGNFIETVSMVEDDRHTVCLSSQVGCNVGCTFCATASMEFTRNLSTGEIVEQLEYIRKNVDTPITNVVFMGMGEPMLNYKNVMKAADIFHDHYGYRLASSRITISTAGVVPKIRQFVEENKKYKLAISLNAPTNTVRREIMPINATWNIKELIDAARPFISKKRRNIMFEYVLMENINDSMKDAQNLMETVKGLNCKLNIIPFNETDGKYKRPSDNRIEAFIQKLIQNQKKIGFRVLVRWSKGQDINAGCGQLAVLNT